MINQNVFINVYLTHFDKENIFCMFFLKTERIYYNLVQLIILLYLNGCILSIYHLLLYRIVNRQNIYQYMKAFLTS